MSESETKIHPLANKLIQQESWHESYYHNVFGSVFDSCHDKTIEDFGNVLILRCIELESRCVGVRKLNSDILEENRVLREQIKRL